MQAQEQDWDFFDDLPAGPALIHGAAPYTRIEWVEDVRMVCRNGRALPAFTHRYRVWGEAMRCGCNASYGCTLN